MAKTDKETKGAKKHFWKDFKAELKKVIWPTPKQIVNNTATVIGIVLITVVIVFILDIAFDALNTYGINKLKTIVDNTTSNEITNTTDNNTDTNNSIDTNNVQESTEEGIDSDVNATNNETTSTEQNNNVQ